MNHSTPPTSVTVPEDRSRLITLRSTGCRIDAKLLIEPLRRDCPILVQNIAPEMADVVLRDVAEGVGLLERLQFHAEFATSLGRRRVGKYGMSVNKRGEYQLIPPHAEGDSLINVQLASFYCLENSTDGGETILMNVDDSSDVWNLLKEKIARIAPGSKSLTPGELMRATGLYRLHSPPYLSPGERIIRERSSEIQGLKLVDVLANPRRSYSSILGRDLYGYWSSIANVDFDSLHSYASLLKGCNLLKEPEGGLELCRMDSVAEDRVWSSGVDYSKLFRCKITHKLTSGDLIILNNLTWVHSASNWSPGSGVRSVAAAFA